MSHFTVELWRAVELSNDNIGLDSYPIFDPDYRASLNEKIKDHYHGREIGQETISMFKLAMRRKMNEIMPYYNKLYLTEKMVFDPFSTVDIRTVANAEGSQNTVNENNSDSVTNMATVNAGETSTTSDSDSESRAVNSDTPQTQLSGNEDYATAATDARSTSGASTTGVEGSTSDVNGNTVDTERATGEANSTQSNDSRTNGYQGNQTVMLMTYRDSLLNIDMLVIDELKELFMLVWDGGDRPDRLYSDLTLY